jgi:hypothetical protein
MKHLKYTGSRVEQYQTLKASRQYMSRSDYVKAIAKLDSKERAALAVKAKRDAARAIKEAAAEAKAAAEAEAKRIARNKARAEKKKAAKADGVLVDFTTAPITSSDEFEVDIKPKIIAGLAKAAAEKYVYIQLSVNGDPEVSKLIELKGGDPDAIYWNSVFNEIVIYYKGEMVILFEKRIVDEKIVTLNPNDRIRFVMLKASKTPSEKIQQKYRDGVKHCVLEPLYNLWMKMSDNSETEGSRKRCRQVANRILKMTAVYPDGVPEGMDMEVVARTCHRCIVIHDILGNEVVRYNSASPKYFRFTNTRINHLEQGQLAWDGEYERITQEAMDTLVYEHDRDEVFYLYGGDVNTKSSKELAKNNCHSLRSVRGAFAVFNDDYDVFKAFNEALGIKDYGVNAVANKDLNEFIKEGRIINSAPVSLFDYPNADDATHIDLEKAYTQHSKTKFYRGFLGHITNHGLIRGDTDAAEFLKTHVGIFQFSFDEDWPMSFLGEHLGLKAGSVYTLPSPEIEYFISTGLQVKLIAGCWGSTFDIKYSDEMLENRRYCTWAGKLGMDNDCSTYTFKGDAGWAACLKEMLGSDKVYYFSSCSMIVVKIPKSCYFTKHHILAFITSYCRINMMEAMDKIQNDGGVVIKVILDGIYYLNGPKPETMDGFKVKPLVEHNAFVPSWYSPSIVSCMDWKEYDDRFEIPAGKVPNVIVLTGAGGTGKSHSVLQNPALSNVLYVTPTHILGRKMKEKTGCNYTTIHKLIGFRTGDKGQIEKTRTYKDENGEPGIMFIDEITMIDASWIDEAIKLYPNTLKFIAGDVDDKQWYQCRNGHPGSFAKIWMPTSRRDHEWKKCDVNIFVDGCEFNGVECHHCNKYVPVGNMAWEGDDEWVCSDCSDKTNIKGYHVVHYTKDWRAKDERLRVLKEELRDEMRRIFTDGNQTDAIRMKMFIQNRIATTKFADAVKMFRGGDIWIAGTHKTNQKLLESGVVSGYINKNKEIVSVAEDGAEKRGSFTTHSFQGLTLETQTVFISLDFFEYAMLYTSISRVCRITQLVIVD